jgi:hypothetical protein
MNKLYLLPIIIVAILSNSPANAISQERKDITIKCAKVYAYGQAVGIAGKLLSPFSMTFETIGRAGSLVGSPIRSVFSTAFCTGITPVFLLPKTKVSMNINGKQLGEHAARSTLAKMSIGTAVKKSIPAVIGFGAIPYLIEKNKTEIDLTLLALKQ